MEAGSVDQAIGVSVLKAAIRQPELALDLITKSLQGQGPAAGQANAAGQPSEGKGQIINIRA